MRYAGYSAMQRVENYALARFPLTNVQIQKGVVSPKNLALLDELVSKENPQPYANIPKHHSVDLLLDKTLLPDMSRSVALKVQLPRSIFLAKNTWFNPKFGADSTKLPNDNEASLFDPIDAGLSADQVIELASWANEAVRQHRLVALANTTLHTIVADCISTTAHLRATWPFLATLIADRNWRDKANTHTRGMARYDPPPWFDKLHAKRMGLVEMLVTQGSLLAKFEADRSKPVAAITWWETVPGDVTE